MPLNRLLLLLTLTLASAGGGASQPATGNLLIQGSDLTAGHDLSLTAQNDIELLAAANTQQLRSSNKSSSASIGVSIGISSKGSASGPALTAGFSQAKGKANGDDLFWSNTHLTAGDTLTLTSGNDTTLRGATASAPQITADIGGDLKLESLQDTSTYDSKQKSSGFSIALSPAGVPVGGSLSGSSSKIASDYRSVTEQTALKAGDGGFDIQVSGNTDLKGAAITSTQTAVKEGKNTFSTAGELTLSDLHNEATYDAQGGSVTLGTQLNEGKYTPQGTSAGYGEDEGHAESTTYAAITGYAGNSTARTGDPESGIDKIFDADKVQKEIDAQVRITQAFGQQASKAVGDYAQSKMKEAANLRALGKADEAKAIEDQWGKNGTLRLLAHTVIGGLTGGPGGAAGAAAGTLTAPAVSDALKDAGITGALADTITALASTTVGVVVGGDAGGGAALNEVGNNFLTHKEIKKGDDAMKDCVKSGGDITACQKKVVSALQELDIARDKELLEAKRIAEFAEYQIHWGCKSDMSCIDQYRSLQGKAESIINAVIRLDQNGEITFDGYHPSLKVDSLLALDGAVSQSQQTYKKISEYLAKKGVGGTLSDVASGLANVIPATVDGATNFITAPIPVQTLEQALDEMTLLTAQGSGVLAFDVTSGMALSYVGGKVMGWTLGKGWQTLSGTAAEMAESYLKKQGLILAVVPEGKGTGTGVNVSREYRGVEIVDSRGSPVGEFDRVENGLLVEDKSALGLDRTNPKTGLPSQTPETWAQKQIYDKTVARIENLKNATGTRPTVDGTPSVPTLAEVQGIKNLEFRIQSASSEVRAAVEAQLQSLREKYPSWNFGAKYGE